LSNFQPEAVGAGRELACVGRAASVRVAPASTSDAVIAAFFLCLTYFFEGVEADGAS
jgi:hypothetical protein